MLKIFHLRRTLTFKLLFVGLSLAIFSLSLVGSAPTPTHAIDTPWLKVVGNKIVDPGGREVILRGVSLIDIGVMDVAHAPSGSARAMIDRALNWYARVIRLPVYPGPIDGSPGWNANPDAYFTNYLDPAIQYCVAKQVYCIIDWHYISDYNNATIDSTTRNFWNYVAPKYKNVPNVIYELFNEPIRPNDWNTWQQWAQPWVDIIRSHAPNNLILIGGPNWSQNVGDADTDPFVGSNLAYVAHIYPCHGTAQCEQTPPRINTWNAWFGDASAVKPYFITEFGWQNGGAVPTSGTTTDFGIPFINYLDEKRVSWTAWTFDAWWQPIMFDANWNILGGENYMGQYTKDALYARRCANLPNAYCPPDIVNGVKVQIIRSVNANEAGETRFNYRVYATGASASTNISVRVYYTADGSNTCSSYSVSKWFDSSGAGTVGAPVTVSGTSCYIPINYGTASLSAGSYWSFEGNIKATNHSAANDHFHTGYAINALPASFTDHQYLPGYVNGIRKWGVEPGGTVNTPSAPTNTPIPPTVVPTRTNTPSVPTNTPIPPTVVPTRTNTPSVPTNTPVQPTATRTNTPIGPTATRTNTSVPPTATRTATRTNTATGPTATRTNTSVPPTVAPTRTNTPLPPPTVTPGGTSTLKVQYKTTVTLSSAQQPAPHFRIVNTGSTAVALSILKIRYYFTRETSTSLPIVIDCDYSSTANGCGQVTMTSGEISPAKPGADYYIEIGFTTSAGSVAAGGNTGETQIRFHATNWLNFTQTGDYSFDPTKTAYADWNKVVLLQNGTAVWGTLP